MFAASTAKLERYTPTGHTDKTVPLLKALLKFAPTQEGRNNVVLEITSCRDDGELRQLQDRYFTGLILPIRAHGGKTPPISAELDESESQFESARTDQGQLKHWCLRRDSYRCVLSGSVDHVSYRSGNAVDVSDEETLEPTVAAHILPFSIAAKDETPPSTAVQRSCRIYDILRRFGGIQLAELNGNEINRFENVFTLSSRLHAAFGYLDIWLDAVSGEQDAYRFRKAYPLAAKIREGTIIRFRSGDARIPLPDPRYIALHAACAKVCHASGTAKVLDRILEDCEETKVLAEDGSSSQTLHNALSMIP